MLHCCDCNCAQASFEYVGTTVKWIGERGSVEEHGVDAADESKVLVRVDPSYFRPTEVELLIGKQTHAASTAEEHVSHDTLRSVSVPCRCTHTNIS
jgi:GDP-D-mannose dehydratase